MDIVRSIPTMGKGGAEDIMITLCNSEVEFANVTLLIFKKVDEDSFNISRLDERVKIKYLLNYHSQSGLLNKFFTIMLYLFSPVLALYLFIQLRLRSKDIVHSNLTIASLYSVFWQFFALLTRSQSQFIETFHTNWHLIGRFQKVVFRCSWAFKSKLIYEILKSEIENLNKIVTDNQKITYIPFGIEEPIVNAKGVEQFKQDFNDVFARPSFKLMTVSRLRLFEKKIDIMLEAVEQLICDYQCDVELFLCGDGKDREAIESLITEKELQGKVHITGFVDAPLDYMACCDGYFCAMVGEDTGISGIQAGFLGKPIIGLQTFAQFNNENSAIFAANTGKELAKFIHDNLLLREQSYLEYSTVCKSYIQSKFSGEAMARSYKSLYLDLLDQ